jgi:hypothetical protein
MIAGHTSTKNDKALIAKLREVKQRHADVISSIFGGGIYH